MFRPRHALAAAMLAVVGVALQTVGPLAGLSRLGYLAAAVSWLFFAAEAAVMLTVGPRRRDWARSHMFELVVVVLACPAWPSLLPSLMLLQLTPALTVFDMAKIAKLVKVVRLVRRRRDGRTVSRLLAAAVLVGAAGVGALVLHS